MKRQTRFIESSVSKIVCIGVPALDKSYNDLDWAWIKYLTTGVLLTGLGILLFG